MLELRPNCELCDRDLPPDSYDARICSYECTFCAECTDTVLRNVCPNCGGGLETRPIRPQKIWRPQRQIGLSHHPAGDKRYNTRFTPEEIEAHVAGIEHLLPHER